MRVKVTIGSAPARQVPKKNQDDRQELQAHAPPHQPVAAPSAFDVAVDIAAHADQAGEQHAERGQSRQDHQEEQDIGEGGHGSNSAVIPSEAQDDSYVLSSI